MVLSETVGNAHRAAGEQEMAAVRGGKRSFNLSLPSGEFYRIKKTTQALGGQLFIVTNIKRHLRLLQGFHSVQFCLDLAKYSSELSHQNLSAKSAEY